MSSVKETAKKLCKAFNNDCLAILADVVPNYERVPFGSLGADFPLYGGLPEGRITGISGQAHGGKSLMSMLAVAAYQRKHPDKMCVYVDTEHALDNGFYYLSPGSGWHADAESIPAPGMEQFPVPGMDDLKETMMMLTGERENEDE